MKKLAFLIVLALEFAVCGCGTNPNPNPDHQHIYHRNLGGPAHWRYRARPAY